jgi:predicted Zn-dependent protease
MPRIAALALLVLTACDVSQDEEVALGRRTAEQVEAQLPIVDDPAVERYVSALGTAIARGADTRGLEWHFRVVDSRAVNAFALPGGYVYVNRGLIERADNLSELAGVLGHEIGHVTLRHSVEQMKKSQGANLGVLLLCALTDVCHSDAARVAIDVGSSAAFAKYSRDDEREADAEAVRNVVRAGISPVGVPSLFDALIAERERQPGLVDAWFGTHPLEESRVVETRRLVASLDPATLNTLVVDSPEFQAIKRRIHALPPPAEPPLPPP